MVDELTEHLDPACEFRRVDVGGVHVGDDRIFDGAMLSTASAWV